MPSSGAETTWNDALERNLRESNVSEPQLLNGDMAFKNLSFISVIDGQSNVFASCFERFLLVLLNTVVKENTSELCYLTARNCTVTYV